MNRIGNISRHGLLQWSLVKRRMFSTKPVYCTWLKEIKPSQQDIFGLKTTDICEIYQNFQEINIPNGFALSTETCKMILEHGGVRLSDIEADEQSLANVREAIMKTKLPDALVSELEDHLHQLEREYGEHVNIVVRSSSIIQESRLDKSPFIEGYASFHGLSNLVESCKKKLADWFYPQYIPVLIDNDKKKLLASLCVQRLVEGTASGLIYSQSIQTGHPNFLEIFSVNGMSGSTIEGDPDRFLLHKQALQQGFRPVLDKYAGRKTVNIGFGQKTCVISQRDPLSQRFLSLSESQVVELGLIAMKLEEHFGKHLIVEFCKDKRDESLYVLEIRQVPSIPRLISPTSMVSYLLEDIGEDSPLIGIGTPLNERIVSGEVTKMDSPNDPFKENTILVAPSVPDESWDEIIKKAKGIILNECPRFSFPYFEAQRFGKPLIELPHATEAIHSRKVTMDGESGKVYEGEIPFIIKKEDLTELPRVKTKLQHVLDTWEDSLRTSLIPNEGVGLLKIEKMFEAIGIHPLAALYPEKCTENTRKIIKELSLSYHSPQELFVSKLSQYVATVCAAYSPKPVLMRFSDFSDIGYTSLLGYKTFEKSEHNPLLGWRGSSRYINPKYVEAFGLECRAVQRVRETMGMKNLHLVVPFVRTVSEIVGVLKILSKHGLERSDGLKVYMHCEIPVNILQADSFLDVIDGYIIDVNDLIQMILGVDRGNEIIANIYDEKNLSIKELIADVIKKCKARNKHIGLCGNLPSQFQDFAEFLVEEEIDSITVSPDKVIETTFLIHEKEKFLDRILSRVPEELVDA